MDVGLGLLGLLAALAAALVNMRLARTFSAGELVLAACAGALWAAPAYLPGPWSTLGRLLSHGLLAPVGPWVGEAGLCLVSASVAVTSAAVASRLDARAGKAAAGVSVLLKLVAAPLTTGVGALLAGFALLLRALEWRVHCRLRDGAVWTEWGRDAAGVSAVTLGGAVHVWRGEGARVAAHEQYHSRQYLYFRDWLIPVWLLGGLWGLCSGAVLGQPRWVWFSASHAHRRLGNPLERAAYRVQNLEISRLWRSSERAKRSFPGSR